MKIDLFKVVHRKRKPESRGSSIDFFFSYTECNEVTDTVFEINLYETDFKYSTLVGVYYGEIPTLKDYYPIVRNRVPDILGFFVESFKHELYLPSVEEQAEVLVRLKAERLRSVFEPPL